MFPEWRENLEWFTRLVGDLQWVEKQAAVETFRFDACVLQTLFNLAVAFDHRWFITTIPRHGVGTRFMDDVF